MEFDRKLLIGILIGMATLYVLLSITHTTPTLGAIAPQTEVDKLRSQQANLTSKISKVETDMAASVGRLTLLQTQIDSATSVVKTSAEASRVAQNNMNIALKNYQTSRQIAQKSALKKTYDASRTNATNVNGKYHRDQQVLADLVRQHDDEIKHKIRLNAELVKLHVDAKLLQAKADASRAAEIEKAHKIAVEAAKRAAAEAAKIAAMAAKKRAEAVAAAKVASDKASKALADTQVKEHARMVNDANKQAAQIKKDLKNTIDAAKKATDNNVKMTAQKNVETATMNLTVAKAHVSAIDAGHKIAGQAAQVSKDASMTAKQNTPAVSKAQKHFDDVKKAREDAAKALNEAKLQFQKHNEQMKSSH